MTDITPDTESIWSYTDQARQHLRLVNFALHRNAFGSRLLANDSVAIGYALLTQSLRQLEAVVLLSESGLEEESLGSGRSLFETAIAFEYLFGDEKIEYLSPKDNSTPNLPRWRSLGVDFKCKLFRLHQTYEHERWVAELKEFPDFFDELGEESEYLNLDFSWLKKVVGDSWCSHIYRSRSYSGMSTRQLVEKLGVAMSTWYQMSYRQTSWKVHAIPSMFWVSYTGSGRSIILNDPERSYSDLGPMWATGSAQMLFWTFLQRFCLDDSLKAWYREIVFADDLT